MAFRKNIASNIPFDFIPKTAIKVHLSSIAVILTKWLLIACLIDDGKPSTAHPVSIRTIFTASSNVFRAFYLSRVMTTGKKHPLISSTQYLISLYRPLYSKAWRFFVKAKSKALFIVHFIFRLFINFTAKHCMTFLFLFYVISVGCVGRSTAAGEYTNTTK